MKTLSHHSHLGLEFDWLACDRFDRCFFLSTAGYGWLPERIVASPYPLDVLSLLLDLPVRCDANMLGDQGTSTNWSEVARRGFYAFDWDHQRSRYTLITEPQIPTLKVDLPLELLRTVGMVMINLDLGSGGVLCREEG